MSSTIVRSRLLTAAGTLIAAAALAAAALVGTAAFADDHTADVTVEATVNDTITLTANDANIALNEAPGETATAGSTLTVETNNFTGYNVTVEPNAGTLDAETEGNDDTIDVGALSLNGEALEYQGETSTEVHTQGERSAENGDTVNVAYALAVPFVATDTYTVGLTFTASAND